MAGCSAAPAAAPATEPTLPDPIPRVDMKTFMLPLDAYVLTQDQVQTRGRARITLMLGCLRRFGFDVPPPGRVDPIPGGTNERRYLLVYEARARTYGYRWPEVDDRQRPPEPDMPPAAQAVLSGEGSSMVGGAEVPPGGCIGESYRAMGMKAEASSEDTVAQRLFGEDYQRMLADSRVKAADAAWSACMARSGYAYAEPGNALSDPAFAGPKLTRAEVQTATADVRCKNETRLPDIMAAVETAYQKRSMQRHEPELRALRTQLDDQLRKAAEVLAGR
jgi:hypothetical protein